jgi:hypothetical protein
MRRPWRSTNRIQIGVEAHHRTPTRQPKRRPCREPNVLQDKTRISITAPIDTLATSGPALAMWDAVLRHDREGGDAILRCVGPVPLLSATAPLVVHLLREAGTCDFISRHLDAPSTPSPRVAFGDQQVGDRGRAVATACCLLGPVIANTIACDPLAQIGVAFLADENRTVLHLHDIYVIQMLALINASALLVAKRRAITVDSVLNEARSAVLVVSS